MRITSVKFQRSLINSRSEGIRNLHLRCGAIYAAVILYMRKYFTATNCTYLCSNTYLPSKLDMKAGTAQTEVQQHLFFHFSHQEYKKVVLPSNAIHKAPPPPYTQSK